MSQVDPDGFERSVRPLLELVQRLTGLETSFVTEIDWASQTQQVSLALNTSDLTVAEGSVVPWSDSMCRRAFLSGKNHSSDVLGDFPGSLGGDQLGMRTFFALPILDPDGEPVGTVCGASTRSVDIEPTVLEHLELIADAMAFQVAAHRERHALRHRAERAEMLAFVDPLTGLANRRGFDSRVEQEAARAGRAGLSIAVLFLDLDDFKQINDTYGHRGGDDILIAMGRVLGSVARTEDVAARLGGDEFALLLAPGHRASAQEVADRMAREFRKATADMGMPCTVSVGISTTVTTPVESLVDAADAELYRQKASRA